jgi:hypothetical protein
MKAMTLKQARDFYAPISGMKRDEPSTIDAALGYRLHPQIHKEPRTGSA